jgi:molybdenum cofactor cytidylyltransferase
VTAPAAAMLLAAGASRRLGQPKQLLTLNGEPLVARMARLAREAGASPVIAVLGAEHEVIRRALPPGLALPVVNNRWEEGIASSIHAGLDALDAHAAETSGVLILACDQPRLTSEHLRALLAAFDDQTVPTVATSAYAGVVGVPAVFPRAIFVELRALSGDKGARSLLAHSTVPIISVPFPGGEIDIDLPADLPQLD